MFTIDTEILIRKFLHEKAANSSEVGEIIPAPIFFKDKADYFANILETSSPSTKKAIEQNSIAFLVISLKKFEDFPAGACADEPLIRLTYNFYLFRTYDYERADETATPDDFLKKNLLSYNTFVKAVFDLRNEFLGVQDVAGVEGAVTKAVVQDEFIEEIENCRYIPGIPGHALDLELPVEILISE